jgi:hypothetical protein
MSEVDGAGISAVLYAKDVARLGAFYAAVTAPAAVHEAGDGVRFEYPGFALDLVRIPPHIADDLHIATPPERREDTPIKLTFPISDLDEARSAAAAAGGSIDGAESEWSHGGRVRVNGCDPEGNIFEVAAGVSAESVPGAR